MYITGVNNVAERTFLGILFKQCPTNYVLRVDIRLRFEFDRVAVDM